MRSLRQCLLDADLVRLHAIARFWDVEVTTNRRQDLVSQLIEAMSTTQAVADAWEALPDEQRHAMEALLASEGSMPMKVFTRRWGEIRAMGPGRMRREQPWLDPISPVEGLWYKGLIARTFEQVPQGAYEAVFVPAELLVHLPRISTPASAISAERLEPVSEPVDVYSEGDAFLDDACTLLIYLQNEPVRPTANNHWPARHKSRVIRRLCNADPVRFDLLWHLIQRLGWLRSVTAPQQAKVVWLRPDPGPVTEWLQSPTAQQRRVFVEEWRDDPTWNDLFHVSSLRPEDTGGWQNDPVLARETILRHLGACEPGVWYVLDDFVAAVKQVNPDFQRIDGSYDTWYIRDAATGRYLSGFDSWDAVEGALIRYLIAKPLTWLGIVDQDDPSSPTIFRLSPAGAALLRLGETPSRARSSPLVLRRDFTLQVPPVRRYERFQLARIADWVKSPTVEKAEGMKGRFIYRLTPTSLERARRQRIPLTRVLEFLDQVTGTDAPVPRPVEAALTRLEARGTEVRLEQVLLLRLSSEELMAQVMASPRIRRFVEEQISPTMALVRERDWSRLIAALGEMGLLTEVVAVEGGGGSPQEE